VTDKLTLLDILSVKTEKLMKLGKKHFILQTWRDHVREAYLEKRRVKFSVFKALKKHAKVSMR
jgi:hypothetical protein